MFCNDLTRIADFTQKSLPSSVHTHHLFISFVSISHAMKWPNWYLWGRYVEFWPYLFCQLVQRIRVIIVQNMTKVWNLAQLPYISLDFRKLRDTCDSSQIMAAILNFKMVAIKIDTANILALRRSRYLIFNCKFTYGADLYPAYLAAISSTTECFYCLLYIEMVTHEVSLYSVG